MNYQYAARRSDRGQRRRWCLDGGSGLGRTLAADV